VTRRLTVTWPDPQPFVGRGGEPIRLLAVADSVDPALEYAVNREALGHVDAIVGAGDLEPSYLAFLGDAFKVPVSYVRGNHDHGSAWGDTIRRAPDHLRAGDLVDVVGVTVAALEWPGLHATHAPRDEWRAWRQVLRACRGVARRRLVGRGSSILVLSHAPPRGVGDHEGNRYHLGYTAYRWLLDWLRPPLWLHGHTHPATRDDWREHHGQSLVANVTGSVIVELVPPNGMAGRA
jgi:hypothetical protein